MMKLPLPKLKASKGPSKGSIRAPFRDPLKGDRG